MKILVTGSTSPQASIKTANRTPTFAALLTHSLMSQGHDVSFVEPYMSYDEQALSHYDAVFVGIAPPTSLSANRVYPAFAIASRALNLGILSLFIDAPEPYKVHASLKSCHLNVSDLQKDFYKMRRDYRDFVGNLSVQDEVYSFISHLYLEEWPTLLVPSFPWSSVEPVRKALPNAGEIVPVNFDADIISLNRLSPDLDKERTYWICDAPKTRWAKKLARTIDHPVFPARGRRWDLEEVTLSRMQSAVGTIVSLYRSDEVWWSPALAQSLSVGVPVVTDWRHSQMLGPEWSYLASSIESMSNGERFELAVSQRDFYVGAVQDNKFELV